MFPRAFGSGRVAGEERRAGDVRVLAETAWVGNLGNWEMSENADPSENVSRGEESLTRRGSQ